MTAIHIGSSSEFIEIALPASFAKDGWAQANVEIAVRCFRGSVKPWVDIADFERLATGLRAMYESLAGQAEFSPMEGQFTLKVACGIGGHIRVTGEAWSQATFENKLEFILELDQTYLQEPLQQLEALRAECR